MSIIIVEYYSEFYSPAVDESMIETVDKFMEFLKSGIGKNDQKAGAQIYLPYKHYLINFSTILLERRRHPYKEQCHECDRNQ